MAPALDILKRIVPWALEANSSKTIHRGNYKGVRGRIGVVGGARDYAGAPYFASIASMRLGADLAYVICSQNASQVIKNYSPDLIVMPLLDCPDDKEFKSEMSCVMDRLHALVIGPGLGREKLLQSRARDLIIEAKTRSLPLVLDADSLMLINEDSSLIKSYHKAILTPNRVELQRMLNTLYPSKSYDLRKLSHKEIGDLVKQCSTDLDVSILAKGPIDFISSPNNVLQFKTDEFMGSNRRCGGQGDILSGLLAVFLHWTEQVSKIDTNNPVQNSTLLASYLAAITTRIANDLAYKEFKNGMLASHMIDKIHVALDSLLSKVSISEKEPEKQQLLKDIKYSGTLNQDEIKRYTRQMIMEEFGPHRQIALKKASALIIGAGGLGCPAAVYLGAGGIGRLGLVDHDVVESNNLHRQILHNVQKVGMLKTESIRESLLAINPNLQVDCHSFKLTRENAVKLFENYDMIIDATDNIVTRFLISDACVVAKKPLISGAALKMDGQLTVYNYDDETPCMRCLFPVSPPAIAVGSCSDNGVLGVIPGIIGVQQALEAIKIGSGLKPAYAGKMLIYDGQLGLFRHITLNKRRKDCEACGPNSKLNHELIDYEKFCGQKSCENGAKPVDILEPDERVSVEEYLKILNSKEPHVLVDVRPLSHSDVSKFSHALAIPVAKLMQDPDGINSIKEALRQNKTDKIYVVCRRGIASQRGTRIIQDFLAKDHPDIVVRDIIGGMTAWAKCIDTSYSCL